jgi:hypothetical protein
MAVERYTVGRSYTRRHHAKADWADLEAVRTVMEEMADGAPYTVENRIAALQRDAIAYLEEKGMPLDPNASCYGDPAWRRENERQSLVWYAINILNTIRFLRQQIDRGDAGLAADFAFDVGVLATEAKMLQYMVSNPAKAGKAKASARSTIVERQRSQWIEEANRFWEKPAKRKWGARAIAKEIDPTKAETIRKVIAGLKPR